MPYWTARPSGRRAELLSFVVINPRHALISCATLACLALTGCTVAATTGPSGVATSAEPTRDAAAVSACKQAGADSQAHTVPPADHMKQVGDLAVSSNDPKIHEAGLKLQAAAQAAVDQGLSGIGSDLPTIQAEASLQSACDSAGYGT